ncbi:MAG: cutinase family protein [Solirubrobacteraceae bacterium]|nr:cutinase family protein [Solirubrobacteraceae bacterium]
MPLFRSASAKRAGVVALILGATTVSPVLAQAFTSEEIFMTTLPTTTTEPVTRDTTPPNPPATTPTCPKYNVVVARGTDQAANQDEGLDGVPYWTNTTPSWYRGGPDQPTGVWWRIASELFYPASGGTPKLSTSTPSDLLRTDLTYPATTYFPNSTPDGTKNLIKYLNIMATACSGGPKQTKFVLLGYSQGALVIGDALSPPSKRRMWFTGTDQLSTAATNAIVAVGLIANPAFNPQFPTRNQADYSQPVYTTGYKAGTYPDSTKAMNDGNFNPAYSGVVQRDVTAYPLATTPTTPPFAGTSLSDYIVNTGLNGDVYKKIRDYCKSRDYICQAGNSQSSPYYHELYKTETTHKKNLAVFALEKILGY